MELGNGCAHLGVVVFEPVQSFQLSDVSELVRVIKLFHFLDSQRRRVHAVVPAGNAT